MNKKIEPFLKYGVPSPLIDLAISKKLTVTSIRATSIDVLMSKFDLTSSEARFLKKCLNRIPIKNEILEELLINNNFTCCCCLGEKGQSYIIHHIEEFERTQDNSYDNLAVLCPVCHDLAHAPRSLTLTISKRALRRAKDSWEARCKAKRLGSHIPDTQPIFETWQTTVDAHENEPMGLLDLTIRKTKDIIAGHFQLINLARGNTYMAGEFEHPNNKFDVDVKLRYWEMQWGIRSSLVEETNIIMTYLNEDEFLWRDLNHVLTDLPILTFRKKRISDA